MGKRTELTSMFKMIATNDKSITDSLAAAHVNEQFSNTVYDEDLLLFITYVATLSFSVDKDNVHLFTFGRRSLKHVNFLLMI